MICRRSWSLLLLISSLGLVGQQCKSVTLQTEANDVAEQAVPPEIKNKIAPAETIRQEPEKTAGKSPTLPGRHLELKKVLTGQQNASLSLLNLFVRPSCLLEGRTGYFDPGAQRIILAEPGFAERPKLRAMSWGTQHNFKSRSYRLHGDCSGQVGFEKLGFLPGTNHLLAISCRQLLLFDATTLELKRSLLDEVQPSLSLSRDGSKVAVARKGQVAVLRKNTWDIQAQWPVTEHLSGLGLSADGMAVAFLTYDRAACSLHIRWLSSPKVPETNRSTDRHCLEFGSVAFLPLPSNARQIAVPFGDSPADFGFQIWDLQEGRMIREHEFKVPPPTPPVFWQVSYSPDLKYAFLTLNSPDYSQDVLAFDAESGQPVYEGEKSAGRISPCMPADIVHPWPGYEPTLELSEDGRFLLTTLGETYKVFELIR